MKKRCLGRTLVLVALSTTLLGATLPAQAIDAPPSEVSSVQPRKTGVRQLDCVLDISSIGNAQCVCRVSMADGYDSDFTLTLQRSTNGRTWSKVINWTGSGSGTLAETRFVTSGFDYRCELTVKVYNSSGKQVATYTEYSDTITY